MPATLRLQGGRWETSQLGKGSVFVLAGGRGSFHVCMWSVSSEALDLISRIQRLLAIFRLWIHESRGRLDVAFLEISALRVQLHSLAGELREARSEEFRTFFNFNSRLQAVEDSVEETLEHQASVLRGLELRARGVSAGAAPLLIVLLQVGRFLWDCEHDVERGLSGSGL